MVDNTVMERVAKNVGCSVEALRAKHESVLSANKANLEATGLSADDIGMKTLRMAAAEMRAVTARLSRSGATMLKGMFVSVPRTKDIAKKQYENMAKTLGNLPEEARMNMVAQGNIVLWEVDDVDGGYIYHHNASLEGKQPFSEGRAERKAESLPKAAMALPDGTHFALIADKSAPTWPSGGENFRYGRYRAQSEPQRDCLWLGSEDGGKVRSIKVRFSGEDAKTQHPTFVLGTLPARLGKNGDTAYAKSGVSVFTEDPSVFNMFSAPPVDGNGGGLLAEHTNIALLDGLGNIEEWLGTLSDSEKWDAQCAVPLEVAHIDPREGGGYVITLADLDITSPVAPLDLWVSREEHAKVDFAVGSVVLALGGAWIGKDDGMPRMMVNGWWVMDSIEGLAASEDLGDDAAQNEDGLAQNDGW